MIGFVSWHLVWVGCSEGPAFVGEDEEVLKAAPDVALCVLTGLVLKGDETDGGCGDPLFFSSSEETLCDGGRCLAEKLRLMGMPIVACHQSVMLIPASRC